MFLCNVLFRKYDDGRRDQDHAGNYRTDRAGDQVCTCAALCEAEEGMLINEVSSQEISQNVAAKSRDDHGSYKCGIYVTADKGDEIKKRIEGDQLQANNEKPKDVPCAKSIEGKTELHAVHQKVSDDGHNVEYDGQYACCNESWEYDDRSAASGNDRSVYRSVRKINSNVPGNEHAPHEGEGTILNALRKSIMQVMNVLERWGIHSAPEEKIEHH